VHVYGSWPSEMLNSSMVVPIAASLAILDEDTAQVTPKLLNALFESFLFFALVFFFFSSPPCDDLD
jgi:hypothetical protein